VRGTGELEARARVAVAGSAALTRRFASHGYDAVRVSPDGEPEDPSGGAPRLVLLDASRAGGSGARATATLQALRRRWPLVDVLVLAPGASAEAVRSLLRAGAHDLVLDAERLWDAVAETLDAQQLLPLVERLAERRVRSSRFEGMLSRSHAMWDVFEACARVAPTDANVLICGETGTGKELLARALHRRSKRRGRFLAINCSALPEHLLESELFGHEKGAFTGATRSHRGLFRNAEGGTLLLDEIGDMPPAAQQSLLRVLEERAVRPVGATQEIPVDVRIVAATHVGLEDAIEKGAFREDLFYRLDVIRFDIPPLRERPEDVVYLLGYFLRSLARHYGVEQPRTNDDFLARLTAYDWPGNVRELENLTERLVLRGKRSVTARDFDRLVRPTEASARRGRPAQERGARSSAASPAGPIDTRRTLEETLGPAVATLEKRYLEALLAETGGRVQEAARRAGISRRTLQRKLASHDIDKARFRER
jgi:DNA-binding NtrC family response regulator